MEELQDIGESLDVAAGGPAQGRVAAGDRTGPRPLEGDWEKDTTELLAQFAQLRGDYERMRHEYREVKADLIHLERRVVNVEENLEDAEIKLRSEITDVIKSFRDLSNKNYNSMEAKFTKATEEMIHSNVRAVNLFEKATEKNLQEMRNLRARQTETEERMANWGGQSVEAAPRSNVSRMCPKAPTFGDNHSPMKFLNELRDYWSAVNPSQEETAYLIGSCLRGIPKDWWDLVKEDGDNFDSFCVKFKERYWNENTQHEVKRKLEFGHYNPTPESSMTNYAVKMFRDAKNLTYPLSDHEIIRKLSRHFNEEIRTAILGRKIQALHEMLELLEKFDTTGPLNTRRLDNSEAKPEHWRGRQNRTENERSNGQKREENWRAKDRSSQSQTRTIRPLTISEEKDEDKDEELVDQQSNHEPEN